MGILIKFIYWKLEGTASIHGCENGITLLGFWLLLVQSIDKTIVFDKFNIIIIIQIQDKLKIKCSKPVTATTPIMGLSSYGEKVKKKSNRILDLNQGPSLKKKNGNNSLRGFSHGTGCIFSTSSRIDWKRTVERYRSPKLGKTTCIKVKFSHMNRTNWYSMEYM